MIIGLVGFIGSGKDTVAQTLVREHGYRRFAFADALKDSVSVIFGWDRDLLEGDTTASRAFRERVDPWWSSKFGYEVTPRLILQKMGTEACRENIHQNIWVHVLANRIKNERNVVIPDVRFPNEVKFIRDAGGIIIRVQRGPEPIWYNDALSTNTIGIDTMDQYKVHESEWAWIGQKIDVTIANDDTLEALRDKVSKVLTDNTTKDTIFHHPV